jgi:amino-acid N-acetyltransferase
VEVRRARPEDLPSALALLGACGLTPSGVADHFHNFWVACDRGRVVATAGLEVYGQVALLRSVATQPAFRGQGLARRLCAQALSEAARLGVRHVYLLTETASGYFARHFGFQEVPRSELDPRLGASEELRGACPDTARPMVCSLDVSTIFDPSTDPEQGGAR